MSKLKSVFVTSMSIAILAQCAILMGASPAMAQANYSIGSAADSVPNSAGSMAGSEILGNENDAFSTLVPTAPQSQPPTDLLAWFWFDRAQIRPTPDGLEPFWGDDFVSKFFSSVSSNVLVPAWNQVMQYDVVRAGVLLIACGMCLSVGASVVLPRLRSK